MCSDNLSHVFWCLFLSASSLATNVSRHVGCGRYRPGWIGIKSLMGLPKTHMAGDNPVSLSGVFRYCSMARWNLSVFRVPPGPVFSMIILLTVFTAISARLLLCAKATEEMRCLTPQLLRNVFILSEVNSGPPSEVSSSLIPKVTNVRRNRVVIPSVPVADASTMGQFEYLSTATR